MLIIDSLLRGLSRILKEEAKKSMELTIYLLCIFFVFSNYKIYHECLLQVL